MPCRAAEQDRRAPRGGLRRFRVPVQPAQDVLVDAVGLRGLRVVLVVQREVIEDVLRRGAVHALDAVLDDDSDFVGERGVVGGYVGHGGRKDQ